MKEKRYTDPDSKRLYDALFMHIGIAVMLLDEECRVVYLNPEAERIMGAALQSCKGKPCSDFATDRCSTDECTVKKLQKGESCSEFQRDGRICQTDAAVIGEKGRRGYIVVIQDATDRKEAERQLRQSKERLSIAFRQTTNSVWEYDLRTKALYQTGGVPQQNLIYQRFENVPESLIEEEFVHPGDAAVFFETFDRLRGGAPEAGCTFRGKQAGGEYGWLRVTYTTVFDANQTPVRAVGVLEDIDDEKQNELWYLQELEYRRSITADALCCCEFNLTQNKLVQADQASMDFLQIKPGDSYTLIAQQAAEKAVAPVDRKRFEEYISLQALLGAFESGQQERSLEYRSSGRWGREIWVRHTAHLIREPLAGDVCCFIYLKDIDEKKRAELAMKKKAECDPLTGLYNRTSIRSRVDGLLSKTTADALCAFYMIDIDNFKQVNDRFGHSEGDRFLIDLAGRLRGTLGDEALLGRMGGDEFAVFLHGMAQQTRATEKAQALCEAISGEWEGCRISASVGIAIAPHHGVTFDELYEKADAALYCAKAAGKNRYAVFESKAADLTPGGRSTAQSLIDELEEIVYISDPETYELLYINRAGRSTVNLTAQECIHKACYEIIQGQSKPCSFCTNKLLQYGTFHIWEHTNAFLNRHFLLKDKLVQWNGRPARMEIAIDITQKENVSQALRLRLEIEQVLLDCIRALLGADSLGSAVDLVLQSLGRFYDADRAYILEFDLENDMGSNTYEWCAQDVSPQLDQLQDVPLSLVPDWKRSFESKKPILWNDLEELRRTEPDEYELLAGQNIHSLYGMPFGETEGLAGFVGVDNPRAHRGDVSILESLAYFIRGEVSKRRMNERMHFMSYHDPLTGLYNRNRYAETTNRMSKNPPERLGVLVADINGLKQINHDLGHTCGDEVIRNVARLLQTHFGNEAAFRLSGDEFVALCTNEDRAGFNRHCNEIKAELEMLENGVSLGYVWNSGDADVERLTRHADERMLIEKQVYYSDTSAVGKRNLPQRLQRLRKALADECFIMYLQPKFDTLTGRICGAEALVRYHDEQHGIITPDLFIPLLERDHTIREIDYFMFEEVCRTLACWKQSGRALIPISINLSRITLMESGLADKLLKIQSRYDVPRNLIEFEITESAGDMERETLAQIGSSLISLGYQISLDDFGSKYSSTFILSVIAWNMLKIDRSLITDIASDPRTRTVVRHLIEVCHELEIGVIAEGVETEQQLKMLKDLGCRYAQGYLFGKPMPLSQFEALAFPR